jgi:large subunit ribosomal protein L15
MLKIGNLHPPKGSVKNKTRRGRGEASGKGKTSGRGHKGALARSGTRRVTYFEGGQMPLSRQLPKRGFHNPFRVEYAVINISDLNRFQEEKEITVELLYKNGLVSKGMLVKLLGNGEIRFPVVVKVDAASQTAISKITEAGGNVEVKS